MRIDQQVEIAVFGVLTVGNRAKDAWIFGTMRRHHLANGHSVLGEKFRRSHLGGLVGAG